MALREIYNFYDVILIRKSGEKSNLKNIAKRFVLGITEMHPQNQHGAAKDVCVGIDKIFGEDNLTWKRSPTPKTLWDQTLGHLRMISIALCSGYVHQVKWDVRSTMVWKVQVISWNTWQDLLTACLRFPGAEKELKPCILYQQQRT